MVSEIAPQNIGLCLLISSKCFDSGELFANLEIGAQNVEILTGLLNQNFISQIKSKRGIIKSDENISQRFNFIKSFRIKVVYDAVVWLL